MTTFIPVTIYDSFIRSVGSGSWGNTDTGQTWLGENSGASVNGTGNISVTTATAPTWKNHYIDLSATGIPNQGTTEILTLVRYTSSVAYPVTAFGPSVRVDGDSFYYLSLQGNYDQIAIRLYSDGVVNELARTAKTLVKSSWYWVRFRVDTALRAKVWSLGSAEPASWLLTTAFWTGANPPPSSGDIGFFYQRSGSDYTIEIRQFGMKTLEDVERGLPVTDTFTRTNSLKWGVADSGHVWTGPVNYDPQTYNPGQTFTLAGTYGTFPVGTGVQALRIGPNVANSETYTRFAVHDQHMNFRVIAKATAWNTPGSDSQSLSTGYYAYLNTSTSQLSLYRLNGGVVTQLGSTVATTAFVLTVVWKLKIRVLGDQISAKAWREADTEPAFQIVHTDTSPLTGSGCAGIRLNSATGTSTLRLTDFTYTVPVTTEVLTTDSLAASSITDTSLILTAEYTNDTDNDGTITGQYKISGSGDDWTPITGWTKNTGSTNFTKTVTGLAGNTQYNFEATFSDPDGILGTNPRTVTATTTANRVTHVRLEAGVTTTTNVALTSYYTGDNNANSTAFVEYRPISTKTFTLYDDFSDLPGTAIASHTPDTGSTWAVKTALTGITPAIRNNSLTLQFDPAYTYTSKEQIVYNTAVPAATDYDIIATLRYIEGGTSLYLLGKYSNVTGDYYAAGLRHLNGNYLWMITKRVSGTIFTLGSTANITTLKEGDAYTLKFELRGDVLTLYVNGVLVLTAVDSSLQAVAGTIGVLWYVDDTPLDVSAFLPVHSILYLESFTRSYPSGMGWIFNGYMNENRTLKTFTRTVTALTASTIYEFRSVVADADGISGPSTVFTTASTDGTSLELDTLSLTPSYTSIIVEVAYDGSSDTNGNGSVAVRYRSAQDSSFWISGVPQETVFNDTVNNVFRTTITGLRPGTIYEVEATNTDPEGIVEGSPASLSAQTMTIGALSDISPLFIEKQYLWKVYDHDGNYLETWRDAGIPNFSWEEAKGVGRLNVDLPRLFSESQHTRTTIALENRVDIFTFAPLSSGIGPNQNVDPDFSLGAWTLGTNATVSSTLGPNDDSALSINSVSATAYTTRSSPIYVSTIRTTEDNFSAIETVKPSEYILSLMARSPLGQLNVFIEAYGKADITGTENLINTSNSVFSIGGSWQVMKLGYTPPLETDYLRVCLRNVGVPEIVASKVVLRSKERLLYRGFIKEINPNVSSDDEGISLTCYGTDFVLDSIYIDFMQFVNTAEARDATKPNLGASDPADMVAKAIDNAIKQNPTKVWLYHTSDSLNMTGEVQEAVFRDIPVAAALENIVDLCPPGWYLIIEPDGLVRLNGPTDATTHKLNIGVEISDYDYTLSSANRKNYIVVNGRQDDLVTEPDGFGTIKAIAFDQQSIDRNGKLTHTINDSELSKPESAQIVADGRLDELNRDEIQGRATVVDNSSILSSDTSIRGYSIEAIKPGDYVTISDAVSGPNFSYWDDFLWDVGYWDVETTEITLEPLPVKKVDYEGERCIIYLNERPPSAVGSYARMHRWLLLKEQSDLRR